MEGESCCSSVCAPAAVSLIPCAGGVGTGLPATPSACPTLCVLWCLPWLIMKTLIDCKASLKLIAFFTLTCRIVKLIDNQLWICLVSKIYVNVHLSHEVKINASHIHCSTKKVIFINVMCTSLPPGFFFLVMYILISSSIHHSVIHALN